PLEEQVLDEMRNPRTVVALVAGAGADPEPERHRADARHLLGDHAFARVQLGENVLLHRAIVLALAPGPDSGRELQARAVALRLVQLLVGEAEERLRVAGVLRA